MGLDLSGNGSTETMYDEEIETWLSDSRVGNNSVLEHRSRRPVLSLLRNCVDRCHVEIPSDTFKVGWQSDFLLVDRLGVRDGWTDSWVIERGLYTVE